MLSLILVLNKCSVWSLCWINAQFDPCVQWMFSLILVFNECSFWSLCEWMLSLILVFNECSVRSLAIAKPVLKNVGLTLVLDVKNYQSDSFTWGWWMMNLMLNDAIGLWLLFLKLKNDESDSRTWWLKNAESDCLLMNEEYRVLCLNLILKNADSCYLLDVECSSVPDVKEGWVWLAGHSSGQHGFPIPRRSKKQKAPAIENQQSVKRERESGAGDR